MKTYTMKRIRDDLVQFDDHITATCYILEGSEKNLLIDTGSGDLDEFEEMLKPFANKPLIAAITHAHADHYANAGVQGLFEAVYMHPADIEILPQMNTYFAMAMADQGKTFTPDMITPIGEGDVIDLGDVHVRVIEMPGHSPGSVFFYAEEKNLLFTGDGIGSGGEFWMQLPCCLTIEQLHANLLKLRQKLPQPEAKILGGHSCQAGEPGTPEYRPVTYRTVDELILACEELLSGGNEIEIRRPDNPFFDDGVKLAVFRGNQMVFRPAAIR